jgi:hypothetical protein
MKIVSIINSLFLEATSHGMNSSKIEQNKILDDNFIFKVGIFIVGFITFFPLLRVGLVINDDLQFSLLARELGIFDFLSDVYATLKATGRAKFFNLFSLYLPYASNSFIYYKIISLGTIIINLIMVSYFMRILFKSKEIFYLSLLIGIIGIQNSWEHNPIVAFPAIFSVPIILFIFSLIFYIFYLRGKNIYFQYSSLFFYLCALFSYEVFILYLPLFFFIAYTINKPEKFIIKNIIKRTAPYIGTSIIYLIVYAAFRAYYGSYYGGAQIESNSLNLSNIVRTMWQFSISSVPTYFFWDSKYRWIFYAFYNEKLYADPGLFSFFQIESSWLVKALLVFMLSTYILRFIRSDCLGKARFKIGIGLLYIFLPTLLVALTQHYQDSVLKDDQRGMQITYFSFLAFVYFSTLIIIFIKQRIRNRVLNKFYIILTGLCLASVSLIVDNTNNYVAKYQIMSDLKWQAVNRFLKTEEYLSVPENAMIYAPSLWNIIGSVGIHDSYWSDYFRIISGKNIRVERDSTQISSKNKDIYFLKYTQLLKDYDQHIIFGKADQLIGDDNVRVLSKKVVIYNLSKYNDYYVMGRVKEPFKNTHLEVNGTKKTMEDYIFQLSINEQMFIKEFGLKRTVLSCSDNMLDVNSIFITQGVNNALEFSSNGKIDYNANMLDAMNTLARAKLEKGWFERDKDVTWISKQAVAIFKSGNVGKVTVKGFVPVDIFNKVYNNALTISLLDDGRMIKKIVFTKTDIHDGYFQIEADVPANRLIKFEIRLDKSFIPLEHKLGGDVRELGVVIRDIHFQ